MTAQQFRLLYTELRHSSLQLVASDFESVSVSYWLARADFGVPVVAVNVQLVPEIESYLCINIHTMLYNVIYMLGVFTEIYSKPLDGNVVYISITTFGHAT